MSLLPGRFLALGLGVAALLAAGQARSQAPAPGYGPGGRAANPSQVFQRPADAQRSGMLTRFTSIIPRLPPDPKRDKFYDTHYGDFPVKIGRDNIFNGGLYGERWKGECTATVLPYFWGTPSNTITQQCKSPLPVSRFLGNFVHPFRPVGMYYDRGVYGPVYDLDPFVPGPGPFPWPCFIRRNLGG